MFVSVDDHLARLPPGDPLHALLGAVDELAGEPRGHWSAAAYTQRVRELLAAKARVDAMVLAALAGWDQRRAWQQDGAASAAAWLVGHAPLSRAHAHRLARAARLLGTHDTTAEALAAGDICADDADVLAAAAAGPRADQYAAHEPALVDAARILHSVADLETVAATWRALADAQRRAARGAAPDTLNEAHLSQTFGGRYVLDADLDPAAGQLVRAALDHAAGGPDPLDAPQRRPRSQRLADALVDLARHYLADPDRDLTATAEVVVHIDADTLTGRPRPLTDVICRTGDGTPLDPDTIRRTGCDAWIRHLTRHGTETLDLGRRVRTATPAQRRAVLARDHHCVFPGCRTPAHRCQIHHLDEVVDPDEIGGVAPPPTAARSTTSTPGNTAAPPTSPTSAASAGTTTTSSTKATGSSGTTPTAGTPATPTATPSTPHPEPAEFGHPGHAGT